MKRFSLVHLLRLTAVVIWAVGVFVGYDAGDQMVTVGREVTYIFSFWRAVGVWFAAFAAGLLVWSAARILALLEKK